MDKKFTEYSHFDLSAINKEVLKKWDDEQVCHKSLEIREGAPSCVFYEGPLSANGMPGIGNSSLPKRCNEIHQRVGRPYP